VQESAVIYTATDATKVTTPEPGMLRQVLAYNPHLMLVRHTFEKGWKGARHSHPHHQMVYVVRDSIVVDGGVEHEAAALEAAEVLDIFTPYRQDYA
jgi:quercetin dioxygenase-like cupin family protein